MDQHLDPDRLQAILEGSERLRPGDRSMADALEQIDAVRVLRLPAAPADAHARLQRQIESLTATRPPGRPWWMLGSWLGAGPFPRPLAQRLAAGALMIAAAGSGASAATGVTPIELASRLGEFGNALISNLGPGGAGFIAAANPADQSATPATTQAGMATSSPSASVTTATTTPAPGSPVPAGAGASTTPEQSVSPGAGQGQPAGNGGPGTATPAASAPGATTNPPATFAAPPPATSSTSPATPGSPTPTATRTATSTQTSTSTPPAVAPTTTPVPPAPTNAPTAASTPASTSTPVTDQVQTYAVADAGSVTLRVSGGTLSIVSISTADGWTATVDQPSPPEVDFRSGDQRLRFSAQLEGNVIKTSVEVR